MTLEPLHCTANASPATAPSSPLLAPTLGGDSQASVPTHPGLMSPGPTPLTSSGRMKQKTYAKLQHISRLPHSPTNPPATCWPPPLPGIDHPPAGPATPIPPLWTMLLTVSNAPANSAPPTPAL
ncbi:hypothetical protein E4T56_gene4608 [Termitomyces sp. T112]|nr:hypothetical protein E4T56_gene4608 [Termitomyces sp. T112]